jgi:hypothetical protein
LIFSKNIDEENLEPILVFDDFYPPFELNRHHQRIGENNNRLNMTIISFLKVTAKLQKK